MLDFKVTDPKGIPEGVMIADSYLMAMYRTGDLLTFETENC